MKIPADINDAAAAARIGASAVVSIRDMMVLLGAPDEELAAMDERNEILEREPWRRNGIKFREVGTLGNGWKAVVAEGEIDWSGTQFDKKANSGDGAAKLPPPNET